MSVFRVGSGNGMPKGRARAEKPADQQGHRASGGSGMADAPTASAMRRALARARDGKPLDAAEAAVLLQARGEDLHDLLGLRRRTRDAGLAAAGRPGVITYSRKVFIPLTRLCRDRCHYCTFVTVPHRLHEPVPVTGRGPRHRPPGRRARLQGSPVHPGRPAGGPLAPGPGVAGRARLRRHAVLRAGHGDPRAGGDRPAAAPQPGRAELAGLPAAQAGRAVHGHDAGDHRDAACSPTQGGPHFGCPDKDPAVRLRVLEDAGRSTSRSPPAS